MPRGGGRGEVEEGEGGEGVGEGEVGGRWAITWGDVLQKFWSVMLGGDQA